MAGGGRMGEGGWGREDGGGRMGEMEKGKVKNTILNQVAGQVEEPHTAITTHPQFTLAHPHN